MLSCRRMPVFAYRALDTREAGDRSGTIAADTPRQARDLLRERGLVVRGLSPAEAPVAALKWRRRSGGAGRMRAQVSGFIREVSTLLGVGVPLLEALETLARQHKGKFHTTILLLRDRVAAGASLAGA